MPSIVRNIIALITGLLVGSIINYCLILIVDYSIPLPEGVDTPFEGLIEITKQVRPQYFLFSYIVYALGTFVGAYLTARMAGSHKLALTLMTGLYFLANGIFSVILLPSAPFRFTFIEFVMSFILP